MSKRLRDVIGKPEEVKGLVEGLRKLQKQGLRVVFSDDNGVSPVEDSADVLVVRPDMSTDCLRIKLDALNLQVRLKNSNLFVTLKAELGSEPSSSADEDVELTVLRKRYEAFCDQKNSVPEQGYRFRDLLGSLLLCTNKGLLLWETNTLGKISTRLPCGEPLRVEKVAVGDEERGEYWALMYTSTGSWSVYRQNDEAVLSLCKSLVRAAHAGCAPEGLDCLGKQLQELIKGESKLIFGSTADLRYRLLALLLHLTGEHSLRWHAREGDGGWWLPIGPDKRFTLKNPRDVGGGGAFGLLGNSFEVYRDQKDRLAYALYDALLMAAKASCRD